MRLRKFDGARAVPLFAPQFIFKLMASDDGNDSLTRALQNAGQDTANIAGQRIIERNLNVQPTLKVRPGWRFNVIVSRDLILKPYGDLP